MTNTVGRELPQSDHAPIPRGRYVGLAVLAVICVALFWDFLSRQVMWAIREPSDWGHTLVVPGIAFWLAYRNRDRILARPFRTTWFGLFVAFLGVSWYLLCVFGPEVLHHHNLRAAGVMLTLGGLVLLFTGWRATWHLLFPLAYLAIFGQAISERLMHHVTFPLQDLTARASAFIMAAFVDIERQGNTLMIMMSDGTERALNVAEACSGMRMLMAFLALGVAMAYVGLQRNWQRVLLVGLGVPIAVLVNVMRVVTLSTLSMADPNFAAGDVHAFVGVIWLIPAFFAYLGLMWVLRNVVVEGEQSTAGNPAIPDTVSGFVDRGFKLLDRRSTTAFAAACVTLLITFVGMRIAVVQLNVYLRKEPVPLVRNLSGIPKTLGPWRATGRDRILEAAMVEELGTDQYLNRLYVKEEAPASPAIQLHVAYYTGMIDAVPHVPDRCLGAAGFEARTLPFNYPLAIPKDEWFVDPAHAASDGAAYMLAPHSEYPSGRLINVRMPFGEFDLRTTEFGVADNPRLRIFAGYNFLTNGHVVGHPYEIRALAFDRSSRYAYYCKVQMTMIGDDDFSVEQFIEYASDLYTHLLPELMLCLADWATVDVLAESEAESSLALNLIPELAN